MKFLKTLGIISLLLAGTRLTAQKMHVILPSDKNIQYTGRINNTNPDRVVFSFPGVSIKAKFQGSAIDVVIKGYGEGGAATTDYFYVIVDNGTPTKFKIIPSQTVYELARKLNDGEHTVELFKLTESQVGKVEFQGFRLAAGKTLVSPTPLPVRKIEFIGNSITCGYGNELSIDDPNSYSAGFTSVNENNYKAWGAITARSLNAQYVCVAYSGRGLYKNYSGSISETLPLIYDRVLADDASPLWDHSRYIPNVIVINLGSNDFNAEAGGYGIVDSATFVNTYISFITQLRGYYPKAAIICAVGTTVNDQYPTGGWKRMKSYVSAVQEYKNKNGDPNVYYFKMDPQKPPYGEDWHPSAATHLNMAAQLTNFINNLPPEIWD